MDGQDEPTLRKRRHTILHREADMNGGRCCVSDDVGQNFLKDLEYCGCRGLIEDGLL
jgi:hypothetical protein